ncbi:hypothetical protein NQZ68_002865 [Dissostichus eleginoides]|nr:hypothetical protein NQZ68_002865 [Dissostichus eleginoides]
MEMLSLAQKKANWINPPEAPWQRGAGSRCSVTPSSGDHTAWAGREGHEGRETPGSRPGLFNWRPAGQIRPRGALETPGGRSKPGERVDTPLTDVINRNLKVALANSSRTSASDIQAISVSPVFTNTTEKENWLLIEVEVMVSTEEARRHLNDLLDDRKVLAQEINHLKQQMEAGDWPAAKIRRRTLIISELETHGALEAPLTKVENLETEMALRNAQIADLQQKVLVADSEGRMKQRFDSITSIVDAKCALKLLVSELVSAKTASGNLESELKQEAGNAQHLRKTMADERNVMSTMDMEQQVQMVELEQRHQEKVLYLLNQIQNKTISEESAETKEEEESAKEKELFQRLQIQEEELEKLRGLREQHQVLLEDNEQCKQKISLLNLASHKNVLMPTTANSANNADESFEYVPPKPKGKRFTTTAKVQQDIDMDELISDDEDERNEDEWHPVKAGIRRTSKKKNKLRG